MAQLATRLHDLPHPPTRQPFLGMEFDPLDQAQVLARLTHRTEGAPFAYIVTPNVQHVVGAAQDPAVLPVYSEAWLSLCDSRPIRRLAAMQGVELPLVTGSDLTVALFDRVIGVGDRVAVICGSREVGEALRAFDPMLDWEIYVPPPGVEPGSLAFQTCVRFVAQSRARFCFVCLGAPKSEAICQAASRLPGATGTALCTGAALEFMLGLKTRAPRWVQRLGLEWVHRMLSDPRRLARRYFSAMLPLLWIWLNSPRQPGP